MFPLLRFKNFQPIAYLISCIDPPPVPPALTSGYFIWKYLFVKYCFVPELHYFQSLFQISSNSEQVLATSSENLGGVAGLGRNVGLPTH